MITQRRGVFESNVAYVPSLIKVDTTRIAITLSFGATIVIGVWWNCPGDRYLCMDAPASKITQLVNHSERRQRHDER